MFSLFSDNNFHNRFERILKFKLTHIFRFNQQWRTVEKLTRYDQCEVSQQTERQEDLQRATPYPGTGSQVVLFVAFISQFISLVPQCLNMYL